MPTLRRTPSFSRPPVIEVALSVQLAEPLPLAIVDYGQVRDVFSSRYPELAEQPPLPRVVEVFGESTSTELEDSVGGLLSTRAPVRLWFMNKQDGALVQVQTDRFVFNWRRAETSSAYPGFEHIFARFRQEWDAFKEAVQRIGYAMPDAELCEVTYVNHIAIGQGWDKYSEIHKLFPGISFPSLRNVPGAVAESAEIQLRFAVTATGGRPGRLHFRTFPASRATDGVQLLVANLVARVRPAGGVDGALTALRDGHDWVVLSFKDMTSSEMHNIWGIENG